MAPPQRNGGLGLVEFTCLPSASQRGKSRLVGIERRPGQILRDLTPVMRRQTSALLFHYAVRECSQDGIRRHHLQKHLVGRFGYLSFVTVGAYTMVDMRARQFFRVGRARAGIQLRYILEGGRSCRSRGDCGRQCLHDQERQQGTGGDAYSGHKSSWTRAARVARNAAARAPSTTR